MTIAQSFRRIGAGLLLFLAGVAVAAAAEPIRLSLEEAIRLALAPEKQPRLQLAAEAERVAESQVQQLRARTALHLEAGIDERVLRFDLRSIGVDFPSVSPFVANVEIPTVVGPFTVMDARVRATKSLVNRAAAREVQAAEESVESVRTQGKALAGQIIAETARAYFNALRAKSEADLAGENVRLSEQSVSLANERRSRGMVTGSEVRHANLDLAGARQTLFAAQTAYASAALQLVAAIGLPLDSTVELTDQPVYRRDDLRLDEAIQKALASRPELAAAGIEVEGLRKKEQAIAAQSLPTLAVFADAGELTVAPTPAGDSTIVSTPTYTAGFEFSVPILDGHHRSSQLAEIESQIRQAKIRQQQTRRQIELQVRLAFESLQAAARQTELAEQTSSLAQQDSGETRARYQAGEASGIDLAAAEARAFQSRHDYLMAVYQHEVARIALAEATGDVAGMKW